MLLSIQKPRVTMKTIRNQLEIVTFQPAASQLACRRGQALSYEKRDIAQKVKK